MCLAIPGLVLTISGDDLITRVGQVKFGGITKEVSLAYVPEAKVGDYVIVHVGFAISTLNEAEANKVFEYLHEMDELQELEVPSIEFEVNGKHYSEISPIIGGAK